MVGARTSHPVGKLRQACGRPERPWTEPARRRSRPSLSYDARAASRSSRRPRAPPSRRSRARDPTLPRPALRSVRRRRPRRGRRPAVRRHRPGRARAPARPPPGQRRPPRPAARTRRATSPTTAIGAPPGRWPPGARTGPCARTRIRRSTSTSRPTACPAPTSSGRQRGFFARLQLEPFGPGGRRPAARADAGRAEGGPLQAPAGDRRQHEPGRRAVRRPERRASAAAWRPSTAGPPDVDVVDDDGVRHRLWAVPADGRRAPTPVAAL